MIATFLDNLGLPKSCELDRTIFKKMLSDNVDLDVTDKKALKDDVVKIKWTHTLKPSTINIEAFADSTREYAEVAILSVVLSKPDRAKRIAGFIHKAIPYPTLLVMAHGAQIAIGVADKRINQADKSKWVVENSWLTQWFDPSSDHTIANAYMAECHISGLPFTNFMAFYDALRDRAIAMIAAERTGSYRVSTPERTENNIKHLAEIDSLTREIGELKAKLKKTKQMAQQITLNTEIKMRKDAIMKLESLMR